MWKSMILTGENVLFMARSRKAEFQIPFERPKMKTLLQSISISVCF